MFRLHSLLYVSATFGMLNVSYDFLGKRLTSNKDLTVKSMDVTIKTCICPLLESCQERPTAAPLRSHRSHPAGTRPVEIDVRRGSSAATLASLGAAFAAGPAPPHVIATALVGGPWWSNIVYTLTMVLFLLGGFPNLEGLENLLSIIFSNFDLLVCLIVTMGIWHDLTSN